MARWRANAHTARVQQAAHEARIRRMFDSVAPAYDRLNHTLSLGQDLLWRTAAARRARLGDGEVALDVGSGTGDLAFALLRRSAPTSRAIGLDISERMCAVAREKAARLGHARRFAAIRGSVLCVPAPDGCLDRVVSGFTMRNVADLERTAREMLRVLRPGGRAVILELSWPTHPLFGPAYRAYFNKVLPRVAMALGGDPDAYRWLPASLAPFPDPAAFARLLLDAGFTRVRYTSLSLGIATIHEAAR